jgi:hypothetical protein
MEEIVRYQFHINLKVNMKQENELEAIPKNNYCIYSIYYINIKIRLQNKEQEDALEFK